MVMHKGTLPIETKRLYLRQAVSTDAGNMFSNWASDSDVTRFLTWPAHESIAVTKMILDNWIRSYQSSTYYQWMIVPKQLNQPIGSISVVSLNDAVSCAEIGYCIGKAWWHQGIMTEALQAVIDFLFREVGLNRIEAKHDFNNPYSGAVMRKCGMSFEGIFHQAGKNNQGICDICCYSILRTTWNRGSHYMEDFSYSNDEILVQEVYRRYDENSRLTRSKAANVEFHTTLRCIEEYLSPRDRILDIGAGTGAYSIYFSRKGYSVSALELADRNIAAFRDKLTPDDRIDLVQGNGLDLSIYPDNSFDIVLLLGPLYHLHQQEDRLTCIQEAKRVCKPGGKLFFSFIGNDIVVLTMQREDPGYLIRGAYDKKSFQLVDFPFVFQTLDRCRALLAQAGISVLREIASDGVSELIQDTINSMDEPTYQQYLRYHDYICEKKECLGMSNHLLFVGEADYTESIKMVN